MESSNKIEAPKAKTMVLAVDCSGSTGGHREYWTKVKEINDELIRNYSNGTIILWDDKVNVVTAHQLTMQCADATGGGGTYPAVIASDRYTPADSDLIIITDGQISIEDAQKCDAIVKGRSFNRVIIYFIFTGGQMDLTVSSAFTRNCAYVKLITIDVSGEKKTLVDASTRDPISIQKYFDQPELFLSQVDTLRGVIFMQNVGKPVNLPLRNSLLDLQTNLLSCLAKRASANKDWTMLDGVLRSDTEQSYSLSVELCLELTSGSNNNLPKQIETAIVELIRLCSENKNYSFNNIVPGRLARAETAAAALVEEVPKPEMVSKSYECPISLDEDLPVLSIVQGPPITADLPAKYLDYLISMPLGVLSDPTLIKKTQERLGQISGMGALQQLFTRGDPLCPFTRRPLASALIPHLPTLDQDRKKYNQANIHALANIFFGDRLVGNASLWLAVVWQIVKQTPHLCQNQEFVSTLESFLTQDWKLRSTNITLSGLPIAPMIKAPVAIGMWYCVASLDIITRQGQMPLLVDDERNRLRSMGKASQHLLPCLELLGYTYPKNITLDRMKQYATFAQMMTLDKDPQSNWRNVLRAQWQNSCCFPSGAIVLLDGPAPDPNPARRRLEELGLGNLPLGQLISLSKLVDKTKTIGVVAIPYQLASCPIPEATVNYGYPKMEEDWIRASISVCPKTMRPFVVDRKERKHWKLCNEIRYGPLDKQCHNFKYFIDFVFQKDRYPATVEEFMLYIADKQANREANPLNTSPEHQLTFLQGLFQDYEVVLGPGFANVPVQEFKRLAFASMREIDRAQLDGSNKLF